VNPQGSKAYHSSYKNNLVLKKLNFLCVLSQLKVNGQAALITESEYFVDGVSGHKFAEPEGLS